MHYLYCEDHQDGRIDPQMCFAIDPLISMKEEVL